MGFRIIPSLILIGKNTRHGQYKEEKPIRKQVFFNILMKMIHSIQVGTATEKP